jgi:CBS domain-containing protein
VAEVLPERLRDLPVVDDDATALEIAALMARSGSPLVAVVDDQGILIGAVTSTACSTGCWPRVTEPAR